MTIITKLRVALRRVTEGNKDPLAVLKTASDITVHTGMDASTWLRRMVITLLRDDFPQFVLPHVRARVNGSFYYLCSDNPKDVEAVANHLRTLPQA